MRRYPSNAFRILGAVALSLHVQASPLFGKEALTPAVSGSPHSAVRLRSIVNGHHVQPHRPEMCRLLHRFADCRNGNANAVDDDLLGEILRRATP
jgi:hypothetical protein